MLLIANGTCSGSQLSVRAWLAIIGVEFTLTGSVLLLRLLSTAILQSMTPKLVKDGASLDRILNSLSSVPFPTQIRMGPRKVARARLIVTIVVFATMVLYKLSFIHVDRNNAQFVRADWLEVGFTPWILGKFCKAVNASLGGRSVFNDN